MDKCNQHSGPPRTPFLYESSRCIEKDVVIVGAGIAGIGAALTLLEQEIKNFTVLEAQSKAGGRILSVHIGNGIYLEEGAQWIHGQNNPVYQWADKYNLTSPSRSDEAQGIYLKEDGTEVPLEIVHQVAGAIGNILEECENFWTIDTKDYPKSVGQYLDTQFDSFVKSQPPSADVDTLRQLYDWHRRFQTIDNSCESLYQLSAKAWGQYGFCGGDDYINLSHGFSSVIEAMMENIPSKSVRYSCPVKQILWDNLFLVNKQVVYSEEISRGEVETITRVKTLTAETSDKNEENGFRSEINYLSNGYHSESKDKLSNFTGNNVHFCSMESENDSPESCKNYSESQTKSHFSFSNDNAIVRNTPLHGFSNGISNGHMKIHNSEEKEIQNPRSSHELTNLDRIIIWCEDGTCYASKHVVVTSSLGYLKENLFHMFRPSLPEHWSQAISSMGFGTISKIFLVYDSAWWDIEDRGFQFIWTGNPHCPHFDPWLKAITGFDVLVSEAPVLLGWVGGTYAEEVENLNETEIASECTRLLSHFTRREIPLPARVVRSSWRSNNYVRGAYSHTTSACDQLGITTHHLTEPVLARERNAIYFAGEALHEKFFSTTHGAFLSGVEQAKKIAEELNRKSRS